jgi:DNA-binding LacI/PurR family transcriptional regulator
MKPETRRRVQATIDQMGYKTNNSAKSLRTGTTRLIGFAVSPLDQPFASYFASKVIDYAREYQYGVVVDTYSNSGTVEDLVADMNQIMADGWIAFATASLIGHAEKLAQYQPIVLTGDFLSHGKMDSVTMPNVESVRDITSRFLAKGYSRIGLIGVPEWVDGTLAENHVGNGSANGYNLTKPNKKVLKVIEAEEGTQELRTRGFLEAFKEAGVEVDWRMLASADRWTISAGFGAMSRVLDRIEGSAGPQAVVCLNDALAIGVMHQLHERGIRVPQDVEVVGFDNVNESQYTNPSLTTIDPDIDDYARMAVKMIIDRIQGYQGEARSYTTGFTLVQRDSAKL